MKTESTPVENPLIQKLLSLSYERGTLAELRRFWSPTTLHYAYPVLGRLGIPDPHHPDAITAAIFAINPTHSSGGNGVGGACRILYRDQENESSDRHFRRLLSSEQLSEVGEQLYRISKRLERESIALDYTKLLWDLRNWAKKSAEIKTKWAMGFWQVSQNLGDGVEA